MVAEQSPISEVEKAFVAQVGSIKNLLEQRQFFGHPDTFPNVDVATRLKKTGQDQYGVGMGAAVSLNINSRGVWQMWQDDKHRRPWKRVGNKFSEAVEFFGSNFDPDYLSRFPQELSVEEENGEAFDNSVQERALFMRENRDDMANNLIRAMKSAADNITNPRQ